MFPPSASRHASIPAGHPAGPQQSQTDAIASESRGRCRFEPSIQERPVDAAEVGVVDEVAPRVVTLACIPKGCAMVISGTKSAAAVAPKSLTSAIWLLKSFENALDMENLIMPRGA
jgi:hypothetical protein